MNQSAKKIEQLTTNIRHHQILMSYCKTRVAQALARETCRTAVAARKAAQKSRDAESALRAAQDAAEAAQCAMDKAWRAHLSTATGHGVQS